jgi:hypothetical protein
MEQIKVFESYDIHHFTGKSGFVGREFKQGIIKSIYLMVKNIFLKMTQPRRSSVSDEVDLMTLASQAKTQLRGDYATSPICWVTDNSYFHTAFSQ